MILAGLDTEYGFTVEGQDVTSQAEDSIAFVRSLPYKGNFYWDYRAENPRRDMRGFEVNRLAQDPQDAQYDLNNSNQTPTHDRADRILECGARFYNDHGHPEFATAECWTLADLLGQEKRGDQVVLQAAYEYQKSFGKAVKVYKNNTDFHGASWGSHESYLVPRGVDFALLAQAIMPILIARQVLSGAGKVGSEVKGPVKYQLSQRADFMVEPMNVETLFRRPVFNTRDEPHSDGHFYRRLHVISGDSNMNPACTRRKVGLVKIALHLLESQRVPTWDLGDPVESFQLVSRDANGEGRINLSGRNWTTPRQVLESYLNAFQTLSIDDPDLDEVANESLSLLDLRHSNFDNFWPQVDWASKLWLLNQYADSGMGWHESMMQSLDLQYHLLSEDEGLYYGLSSLIESPQVVVKNEPPNGSRALVRSFALNRFANQIESISWGQINFRNGSTLKLNPSRWYEPVPQSVETIEQLIEWVNK